MAIFLAMFPFFVKANAILVNNRYDDVYTFYYDASLGRTRYMEASKYSFNGKVAYCLEIGKRIESIDYNVYDNFNNINISDDDLYYIKIIAYYGYNYPGHQTDNFYMATQEIIWTRLIRTNVKWTNGFNPDDFIYLEREKEVIYDFYRKHHRKPSFDGEEIDVVLGEDNVIVDDNNVLDMYQVKNKGVSIDGNRLIIGSDYDGKDIVLERPKYTNDSFLLYTSGISQKMMTVGEIDMPSSSLKVNVISGSIGINKYDVDTGSDTASGEASLDGAVYGLYNSSDELVDRFIIGEKERIDKLAIGKYYIKEIKAGTGYLLDDSVYEIEITSDDLDISIDVYDKVMERQVDIFKVFASNETGIMTGEECVSFEIYDRGNNLVDMIITDSDGYASVVLPYGTYVFHQVNASLGYYKVDDFEVVIDNFDRRPIYKLLSDSQITSKVKIIKKDMDTLDNIVNSKIRFKIFDVNSNSYVSFKVTYPEVKVIDEFEVNEDGTFITPDSLCYGDYILYEVDSLMDGYVYNDDGIRFTIGDSSNFINDDDYGVILEVPFYNKRVKGNVIINKYGEDIVYVDDMYYYKDIYLDNVYFELYAKDDIYENGHLIYAKDYLIGECITDDGGLCEYNDLPLGSYYLKEVKSNYGNVIDKDIYDIDISYRDQYTDVINIEKDVFNYLNKGKVIINKYESNSKNVIPNTLIEIRNMEDLVVYKGYTNSNGQIILDDLVYGEYYISEVEASSGYRLLEDDIYFTLDKDEVSIDIYNDRVEVPNTGKDIGMVNVLSLCSIVLFIIILILFFDNRKIMVICLFAILISSIYLGCYFYKYFGDNIWNNRAIEDFFSDNIDDKYDDEYKYTSVIEIPSINLKRGIVDFDSKYNDVKYNVELISKDDNRVILASHNGNYYYSYFDKLKDMELGEYIYFYDNDRKYRFVYSKSYVIKKNGYADIYCGDKKCVVLITCLDGNDDAQMVYVGYLDSVEPYGNGE